MSKHIIMTEANGSSFLKQQAAPTFAATEYKGWKGLALEDSGVFFFMFEIEPGAVEYPLHASGDEWLAYVIEGSGELISGEGNTRQLDKMAFAAGDFITFKKNTPHAWRNGNGKSRILFSKRSG
jgi:quercetin dioxygenase-like cupin family protein